MAYQIPAIPQFIEAANVFRISSASDMVVILDLEISDPYIISGEYDLFKGRIISDSGPSLFGHRDIELTTIDIGATLGSIDLGKDAVYETVRCGLYSRKSLEYGKLCRSNC